MNASGPNSRENIMEQRLSEISSGFIQAKILMTGAELRVFDPVSGDGATAGEVAEKVGGTVRGIEILLDALTAMEILDKRDGVYRLRPEYEPYLREDSPVHFPAGLRHRNRMFRVWSFLEERIRGEERPEFRRSVVEDPEANENFIRAMYAYSRDNVSAVVDRIDLAGVRRVADLGGGPGHYLEEFARRLPEAEGYLVDLPLTLNVARKVLAESPARDRIRFVEWDFYADPPPPDMPEQDLVFVSQVLHAASPDSNVEFLRRLRPRVAPGGRVVIHENAVNPDRISPVWAALFAVNMLAMTDGGRTYTEDEMLEWGREAGFEAEAGERIHERSYLVRMRKPE
jgi:SAM-dependent methyltransferase